jgi:hypothetical protein
MRIAHKHKIAVLLVALLLLVVLMLLPRHGHGSGVQEQQFGDYVVHYNALTTSQLPAASAKTYGFERSDSRGLLNVAVETQRNGAAQMISAEVRAEVSDLTGHAQPIALKETSENGDVDYIGDFPLSGSGAYVFTVKVTPPGRTQPFVVRFNRDYVID